MKETLIELEELATQLDYKDVRSIEGWCKENKLPIIKMGKKKYTVSVFLDLFIENELKLFVRANYENAEKIMESIKDDDKIEFAELINAPVSKKVLTKYSARVNSKAAQDYINKFKAA
jgi:Mg/Co/Ni transporter MgtE